MDTTFIPFEGRKMTLDDMLAIGIDKTNVHDQDKINYREQKAYSHTQKIKP